MSNNSINMSISIDGLTQTARDVKKLSDEVADLTEKQSALLKQKGQLEKANDKNSESYKKLKKDIKEVDESLRENKTKFKETMMEAKATDLTFNQLRERASRLKHELDNTVKSANPEQWNKLNKTLNETKDQMGSLEGRAQKVQKSMTFKDKKSPSFMDQAKSLIPALGVYDAARKALEIGMNFVVESWDKAKKVQADGIKSMKVFGDELGYVEARAGGVNDPFFIDYFLLDNNNIYYTIKE